MGGGGVGRVGWGGGGSRWGNLGWWVGGDSVGVLHRLGREGCYVGKGKIFRGPSAPPNVWPVAINPW